MLIKITKFLFLTLLTIVPEISIAQVLEPGTVTENIIANEAVAGVSPEVAYIFNTLSFLVMGFLVMFMAAGFCMLETGMVRSCSVIGILIKNISLYAIACTMFLLVGYNLMYMDVNGFMGTISLWSANDSAVAQGDYSSGYSSSSDWFFQMVFVATAASIVSGTLAERIKVIPFLLFVCVLSGFLYPVIGSWKWGGGWLDEIGFQDFAGSTLVHSVGGWAALAGAYFLGPRVGRYSDDGSIKSMPASSLPLVTLGTFVLWLGWFGFNGGSQLALGSGADATAIADIFVNTNMAAAGGVISSLIITQLFFKKIELTYVLNGALGGLVSITAEPLNPSAIEALLIGASGGVVVILSTQFLDKRKIDDVVGAIPVHLCCGIWGTLIVPFTNSDATYTSQLAGIGAIGLFALIGSTIVWGILKSTVGIRLSDKSQVEGADLTEYGHRAYTEFDIHGDEGEYKV